MANWRSPDDCAHLNELLHWSLLWRPCGERILSEEAGFRRGLQRADKPILSTLARSMRRPIVAIPPITRISTLSHSGANLILALPHILAFSDARFPPPPWPALL